jgi:hypothetical protein
VSARRCSTRAVAQPDLHGPRQADAHRDEQRAEPQPDTERRGAAAELAGSEAIAEPGAGEGHAEQRVPAEPGGRARPPGAKITVV